MIFTTIGKYLQGVFTGATPRWVELSARGDYLTIQLNYIFYFREVIIGVDVKEEGCCIIESEAFFKTMAKLKKDDILTFSTRQYQYQIQFDGGYRIDGILSDESPIELPKYMELVGTIDDGVRVIKSLLAFLKRSVLTNGTQVREITVTPDSMIAMSNIAVARVPIEGETIWHGVPVTLTEFAFKFPTSWNGERLRVSVKDKWICFAREGKSDGIYIRGGWYEREYSHYDALFNNKLERTTVRIDAGDWTKSLKTALVYCPNQRHLQYAHVMYNPEVDEFGCFTDEWRGNQLEWCGYPCELYEWGMLNEVAVHIPTTLGILEGASGQIEVSCLVDKLIIINIDAVEYAIIGKVR